MPNCSNRLKQLGISVQPPGRIQSSLRTSRKSTDNLEKIFVEDHVNVATSYNNLTLVYNSLGEYIQAKELHEKALQFAKRFLVKIMPM